MVMGAIAGVAKSVGSKVGAAAKNSINEGKEQFKKDVQEVKDVFKSEGGKGAEEHKKQEEQAKTVTPPPPEPDNRTKGDVTAVGSSPGNINQQGGVVDIPAREDVTPVNTGLNALSNPITPTQNVSRVDDPRNIEATLQAGQDAIAGRNAAVTDPTTEQGKEPIDVYQPLDTTPEDTTVGPTYATQSPEQAQGGRVDALGTSGVTGGAAERPPGFEDVPTVETDRTGAPISSVAQSDRMTFDDGTPVEPPPGTELDQSGRVKRPAFWKVALDAVFGQMPLIPGSKLATIPLARAREDYYKQDKRDQELTDTFLKEMGEGDWDRAKQLARTNVFRDAVTRTMNMTPDDLINLDQQIQANSTESLQNLMQKSKGEMAKIAQQAGGRFTGEYDKDGIPVMKGAERPIKNIGGIAMQWDDTLQDWTVAYDKEKEKDARRLKQFMDAGYSKEEATIAMLTEGTGVPRFKNIKVGNGVVAMYDQFSGVTKQFKFADAVEANMAMEIFPDEFGVPIGYIMYDKNKGAPTDLSKTTPIFFKDMEWGDQSNGRYTWYDALQGRVRSSKKDGKPFSVFSWISRYFGGIEVTDQNNAMPPGDEFSDYSNNGRMNEQLPPPQKVTTPPPVAAPQKGVDKSEQVKANDFLSTATGSKPMSGTQNRKGVDYSA